MKPGINQSGTEQLVPPTPGMQADRFDKPQSANNSGEHGTACRRFPHRETE